MAASLDPRALEERTQAIGQELFAAAKRESAHLSVLNRWTQQVLAWCLADPTLKSSVLRFIDVLPSLRSPRAIARHVLEYFPATNLRLPSALRVGATLARSGLLTAPAVSSVITQMVEQVGRQFIAESRAEGLQQMVQQLASRGAACSLDVLGEQVLSEAEAGRYAQQCRQALQQLAAAYDALPPATPLVTCGPRPHLSVKPSALTPRFDPISPPSRIAQPATRLAPILQQAKESKALVTLDMEQYALRDLTLVLATQLLEQSGVGPPAGLGIVIQAYLRDAQASTEQLLQWLAVRRCPLTVRLVKGAYWDHEVAHAAGRYWQIPVYQDKAATDAAFERLTQRLLSAHQMVTTAIASHNVRSIAHAMAVAEALGIPKTQVEFQLLYGMGDALGAAIVGLGYPLRIYTPVGELIPGMAYLVRRLLENTSNESFLRQESAAERNPEALLKAPLVTENGIPPPPWLLAAGPGGPLAFFPKGARPTQRSRAIGGVRAQWGRWPGSSV